MTAIYACYLTAMCQDYSLGDLRCVYYNLDARYIHKHQFAEVGSLPVPTGGPSARH